MTEHSTIPAVCAEGCYKHYVTGLGWVRCKCGS